MFQFNMYSIPVLLASFLGILLFYLAWRRGNHKGEWYFALSMLSGSFYCFFYWVELNASDLVIFKAALLLEYTGAPFIAPFLLLFALSYAGRKEYISTFRVIAIFLIPVIIAIMAFTNSLHELFYTDFRIVDNSYFQVLVTGKGAVYYLHQLYTVFITVVSNVLIMMLLFTTQRAYFDRVAIVLSGILITWIAYLFYLAGAIPLGIDLVPFTFSFSSIIFYVGLIRFKVFHVLPLAYESIFESLHDGILIVDTKGFVITSNKVAKIIFNKVSQNSEIPFKAYTENWPSINSYFEQRLPHRVFEKKVLNENDQTWYFLSIYPLTDTYENTVGTVVSLRNVYKDV